MTDHLATVGMLGGLAVILYGLVGKGPSVPCLIWGTVAIVTGFCVVVA